MDEIKDFFDKKIVETPKPPKTEPKELTKAYRARKLKENPKWDAERAKAYRLKHPETYNFIQARYFWKKLTAEQKRLLNELLV